MHVDIDFRMTQGAVAEFKRVLGEIGGDANIVRISVGGGGCSGFNYGLGFVSPEEVGPADVVGEVDGLKFAVDRKSLLLLDGVSLDWAEEPRGFRFDNPNAKKSCCRGGNPCR